jgi:DNA-binding XRE family transcriptional regulator
MPRAGYIPRSRYWRIWRTLQEKGIVGVYRLNSEQGRITKAEEKEVRAQWPTSRIAALAEKCGVTQPRVAALLGLNKKTFERLRFGEWTPSHQLCRRMELLEHHAANGLLYPNIVPARSEMRRRLILFRAWWFAQVPSRKLPEVELKIRVRWGAHAVQTLDLPVTLLPRMKLVKWSGLAELAKEITLAARRASKAAGTLTWTEGEQEFWSRYANETLPAIITERAHKQQAGNRAKKKEKDEQSS